MKPELKIKRRPFTMSLDPKILKEARYLGINVQVTIEQSLSEAILAVRGAKVSMVGADKK